MKSSLKIVYRCAYWRYMKIRGTIRISLDDGHKLEIWADGHYQLWKDDVMLVEGDNVADTLFAYGSTVAPDHTIASH